MCGQWVIALRLFSLIVIVPYELPLSEKAVYCILNAVWLIVRDVEEISKIQEQ
jgi:hypothetical protein